MHSKGTCIYYLNKLLIKIELNFKKGDTSSGFYDGDFVLRAELPACSMTKITILKVILA